MNKIFGIGLSRTGTTSLTQILKQVGINILHYPTKKQVMFNANGDGACDIPVALFYKKLDKAFPGAKFIYTIRDKSTWMESIEHHIRQRPSKNYPSWHKSIREQVYGCMDFDRQSYSNAYDKHDRDVRNYFANRPNDLLILDIIGGDSPKKLFDFLGIRNNSIVSFPQAHKRK